MKSNRVRHSGHANGWGNLAALLLAGAGVVLWWQLGGLGRINQQMPLVRPQGHGELAPAPVLPGPGVADPAAKTDGAIALVQPREAESYWVETVGNDMVLIPQPVKVAGLLTPEAALKLAFTDLLGNAGDMGFSAIPAGTRLLNISVKPDGVHVDLSREFGTGGGSASMIERVGQVIFTASSLDPEKPVFLAIEGRPLNEQNPLGGEGLVLTQPMLRREFVAQYLAY